MRRYPARDGQVTEGQPRNGRLPDGVPAGNDEMTKAHAAGRASFASSEFAAPDMATPRFARKPAAQGSGAVATTPQQRRLYGAQAVVEGATQDARRGAPRASGRKMIPGGRAILFAAILFLLGALAFGVMLNGSGGLPPCAEQPHWNQYNCSIF